MTVVETVYIRTRVRLFIDSMEFNIPASNISYTSYIP